MRIPSTGHGKPRPEEQRLQARRASATRDAGLRRVSRLTGWAVALAIGLTGFLSEVAAQALPGHSKRAASSSPRSLPRRSVPDLALAPPAADQTSEAPDPQPPEQAPAPSDADGGAVSGGS